MTAFSAPPTGPDWQQWARQLGDRLTRLWPNLQFRTSRDTAAENGLLMWDDDNGYAVVSKDGAFVPLLSGTLDTIPAPVASVDFAQQQALNFVIENRTSDPGSPVSGQIWLRTDL